MRWLARFAAVVVAAALLVACDSGPAKPAFQLTDVTGAEFGRDFQLTDHNGKARSLADFRGKVVAVFFGFTHCPDICPTAMAELATIARDLGPDADKLQVLFITVDPERDTQAVLAQYVPFFYPSFLGLRGDADALSRTAKEFKVYYSRQPLPGGGYTMDHTAGIYLYDRQGRLRVFAPHNRSAGALAADIRTLIAQ